MLGGVLVLRLEIRVRFVSDWVMGGGVGGLEGIIFKGSVIYCYIVIC